MGMWKAVWKNVGQGMLALSSRILAAASIVCGRCATAPIDVMLPYVRSSWEAVLQHADRATEREAMPEKALSRATDPNSTVAGSGPERAPESPPATRTDGIAITKTPLIAPTDATRVTDNSPIRSRPFEI